MDFGETHQRKTLREQLFVVMPLSFILVASIVCILLIAFFYHEPITSGEIEEQVVEDVSDDAINSNTDSSQEEVVKSIIPIDFQPVIDEWVENARGNFSVLIYDLELDKVVGSFNPSESYNTASLYKLFVVYNGYQKIVSGEWNPDDAVSWTGYTILDCLDLAIRESYSPCAESLWSMIGRDNLQQTIVDDFSIVNSDINGLVSNPNDIMAMMKIFYEHKDITDSSLIDRMTDSFLNQPVTTYDWRQGLPSGFSRANVYNKVGWDYNPDGNYWNIYHDAAIVEFPEDNRHFIVVVMTNRVPFQKIRSLGTMIEIAYYDNQ